MTNENKEKELNEKPFIVLNDAKSIKMPVTDGTPKTASTRSGSGKVKNPCGHCKKECSSGNSVPCGFCEFWFHSDCVDGMSPEFVASCDAINRLTGGSSFLCVICRKLATKLNAGMREANDRITKLEQMLTTAELERKYLTERIDGMENKNRQVNENVMKMENEVATGMEKAKEEVKDEMRDEMKAREEIKDCMVIYGLVESKEADIAKNKAEDLEVVKKIAADIGVEVKGAIQVKFRSGRVVGDKPRPLVMKFEDDETREAMLANARRLAIKDEWKRVFLGPELTWRQREEGRKEEAKLKEDAERRTTASKNEGRVGRFVVVGQRGRRWTKWVDERVQ